MLTRAATVLNIVGVKAKLARYGYVKLGSMLSVLFAWENKLLLPMEYTVELSSLTQELTFQTIQVRLYEMILTGFHEPIWKFLTLKALGFFFSFFIVSWWHKLQRICNGGYWRQERRIPLFSETQCRGRKQQGKGRNLEQRQVENNNK